jgi:hypothetical protein
MLLLLLLLLLCRDTSTHRLLLLAALHVARQAQRGVEPDEAHGQVRTRGTRQRTRHGAKRQQCDLQAQRAGRLSLTQRPGAAAAHQCGRRARVLLQRNTLCADGGTGRSRATPHTRAS